jgi:hypothetical protein
MKNETENELLSAYLDGELDDAERARVERLLADSPAARQLLDELRALSSTLRSLPRHELEKDLSEEVMLSAGRRKANGIDAPRPAPSPSVPGGPRLLILRRKIADRVKDNPRMVVWPLIVLAVAVMLMVFDPDRRDAGRGNADRNIAMAPKGDRSAENRIPDVKIVEPKEGAFVKPENQPSISAAKSPNAAPNASQLVIKGGPNKADQPSAASLAGLIVLKCQASGVALEKQAYRKVFEDNHVVLPEQPVGEVLRMTPAEVAALAGIEAADVIDASRTANAKPKAIILLVEATPAQLAGIMNGLNAMRDQFPQVSIHTPSLPPSPAPPLPGAKAPAAKRVLVVFRVLDAAPSTPAEN